MASGYIKCDICGQRVDKPKECGTGYGTNNKNQIVCYECCAKQDKADMRDTGKAVLYLTIDGVYASVSNWPNSLRIPCTSIRQGRHNIVGIRYDVWFLFDGFFWHGTTYGDNTQLCHCKKTKQTA